MFIECFAKLLPILRSAQDIDITPLAGFHFQGFAKRLIRLREPKGGFSGKSFFTSKCFEEHEKLREERQVLPEQVREPHAHPSTPP